MYAAPSPSAMGSRRGLLYFFLSLATHLHRDSRDRRDNCALIT
jgi:hypothetical protein